MISISQPLTLVSTTCTCIYSIHCTSRPAGGLCCYMYHEFLVSSVWSCIHKHAQTYTKMCTDARPLAHNLEVSTTTRQQRPTTTFNVGCVCKHTRERPSPSPQGLRCTRPPLVCFPPVCVVAVFNCSKQITSLAWTRKAGVCVVASALTVGLP